MIKKQTRLVTILSILTCFFISIEIVFFWIDLAASGLTGPILTTFKKLIHSPYLFKPLLFFICAQIFLYAAFVYVLWFITVSIANLFSLQTRTTKWIGIGLWLMSVLAILSANTYFVSHSFFSALLLNYVFKNALTETMISIAMLSSSVICGAAALLALINLIFDLRAQQHLARNGLMIGFLTLIFALTQTDSLLPASKKISAATNTRPNIFIISFDALRPDFLSHFDKAHGNTPHFDEFLQSAIVFNNAFTPLARTYPSWTGILTGQYPLHSHGREDNIDVSTLVLDETLPKRLKQAGYETIYASDDNRFSYLNKEFGFDHVLGNRGDVADFFLNSINDYPLSNLIIPTRLGKLLFPYNHGDHAFAATYSTQNFLGVLDNALAKQGDKPLFLAVHFNVTAWPFYEVNDHTHFNTPTITLYKDSVQSADRLFNQFLTHLNAQGFLNHAIVVLISDHGIALALPGDRITTAALYQGDKNNIKLTRMRYSIISADHPDKNYGIDTTYGYGGDILSQVQMRPVLAFKAYGVDIGVPHAIAGRSLLLDISPTLLDILKLPPMQHADGISLKPYFLNPQLALANERPIFFETGFSMDEIQQEKISLGTVLNSSLNLFDISPKTGLVTFIPARENIIISRKQRAVLSGDWLLVYYPESFRFRVDRQHGTLQRYVYPPHVVLANIRTREWTTEFDTGFAKAAGVDRLNQQLIKFYGSEMDFYRRTL